MPITRYSLYLITTGTNTCEYVRGAVKVRDHRSYEIFTIPELAKMVESSKDLRLLHEPMDCVSNDVMQMSLTYSSPSGCLLREPSISK